MKEYIEMRAIMLATYIIEHRATVRATAKQFGYSKSSIHKDVTTRLCDIDPLLALSVKEVLDTNKAERHIRGGLATKKKYMETSVQKKNCNRTHSKQNDC